MNHFRGVGSILCIPPSFGYPLTLFRLFVQRLATIALQLHDFSWPFYFSIRLIRGIIAGIVEKEGVKKIIP